MLFEDKETLQETRSIMIMNAFFIAVLIARGGKARYQRVERGEIGHGLAKYFRANALFMAARGTQNERGQIFAAVNRGVFRGQAHVPIGAQAVQFGMMNGGEVARAGQMGIERAVARQESQAGRFGIDREAMFAQTDDVSIAFKEFTFIAQAAHGLVFECGKTCFYIVGAHAVLQAAQFSGEFAHFMHQRVGGEIGVERFGVAKGLRATGDIVEQAFGAVAKLLRFAAARFQQLLFAFAERAMDVFAFVDEIGQEGVIVGKAAFQIFQLHEQTRQRVVAVLRAADVIERIAQTLRQQFKLGGKLRCRFFRTQALPFIARPRPFLIEPCINGGEIVNDARAQGGVCNGERVHQLGKFVQPLCGVLDVGGDGVQFVAFVGLINTRGIALQFLFIGRKGLGLRQKGDGFGTEFIGERLRLVLQRC